MSDSLTLLRRLHDHRLWVRLRLLESVSGLSEEQLRTPFEMGVGSLFATLEHMHGAERVWLGALIDDPSLHYPEPGECGGMPGLLRVWSDLDVAWERYLATLTTHDLDRTLTRTNRAGVAVTVSVEDILVHVCTHGFYHTAQASNMLRHLGAAVDGPTDFIAFSRERLASVG